MNILEILLREFSRRLISPDLTWQYVIEEVMSGHEKESSPCDLFFVIDYSTFGCTCLTTLQSVTLSQTQFIFTTVAVSFIDFCSPTHQTLAFLPPRGVIYGFIC